MAQSCIQGLAAHCRKVARILYSVQENVPLGIFLYQLVQLAAAALRRLISSADETRNSLDAPASSLRQCAASPPTPYQLAPDAYLAVYPLSVSLPARL